MKRWLGLGVLLAACANATGDPDVDGYDAGDQGKKDAGKGDDVTPDMDAGGAPGDVAAAKPGYYPGEFSMNFEISEFWDALASDIIRVDRYSQLQSLLQ